MRFLRDAGTAVALVGFIGLIFASSVGLLGEVVGGTCGALLGGAVFWCTSKLFRSTGVWVRIVSALVSLFLALIPLSLILCASMPRPGQHGGGGGAVAISMLVAPPALALSLVFGAGIGQGGEAATPLPGKER